MSAFLFGTPQKFEQRSTLGKEQQPLYNQLMAATQGKGAGGAFGQSADYYRNLLSDENADVNAFAAPEMRRFREDIIPGLSEQFAGMGSGGLSSSGFRNAAVNAGADLSERIAAIRAGLRSQGAQGLSSLGAQGLGQYNENINVAPQQGFLGSSLGPALGAVGSAFGGPVLGAVGSAAGNAVGNWLKPKGSTSPYGEKG